jgi:hypothetical protein
LIPGADAGEAVARSHAIPARFGEIHPRNLSPSVATLAMGAASMLWY